MSCKVCPDYAKDYKNEFLFIRGIDKCFQYYVEKIKNRRYRVLDARVGRINKYLDSLDRTRSISSHLIEIKECGVKCSIYLKRLLNEIKENFDNYIGAREEDVNDIDFYFPVFNNLFRCIERFNSKLKKKMVYVYFGI